MAIYHLNAQIIGRSDGRSSVAASAYRCGLKIADARTGCVYDFTRKRGIDCFEILAPADAPAFCASVPELWNAVEAKESRINSQLAREFNIAIPHELSDDAKRELVRRFVRSQFVSAGVVAMVAFHDLASHNPHAHVMTTTRKVNGQGWGEKARELNSVEKLREWRSAWQEQANHTLEVAGSPARIDCRTLDAQGIDRPPDNQPSAVWHMRVRGEAPARYLPPFRSRNRAVRQLSRLLHGLRAMARLALIRRFYDPSATPEPVHGSPFPSQDRGQDIGRNTAGGFTAESVPAVRSRNGDRDRGSERIGLPDRFLPSRRRRPNPKRAKVYRL